MKNQEKFSVRRIVRRLARHWRKNPTASDSADGIGRWWFDTQAGVSMSELTVALAWMQKCSLIESVTAADQRVRHRRVASDSVLDGLISDADGVGPSA